MKIFNSDSLTSLFVTFATVLLGSLSYGAYVYMTYDPDQVLKERIDKDMVPKLLADSLLREKVQAKEFRELVISDARRLGDPSKITFSIKETKTWGEIKITYMDKDANVLDSRIVEFEQK